jgi:hypothetical protein
MQAAPSIEGITVKAYSGNWVIGTVKMGQTGNIPGLGELDVNGIVIATTTPITRDYTASISSLAYQYGPTSTGGTPTSYSVTNQTYNIASGATFNSYDGTTYYGIMPGLTGNPSPRLQINQVTGFSVS